MSTVRHPFVFVIIFIYACDCCFSLFSKWNAFWTSRRLGNVEVAWHKVAQRIEAAAVLINWLEPFVYLYYFFSNECCRFARGYRAFGIDYG